MPSIFRQSRDIDITIDDYVVNKRYLSYASERDILSEYIQRYAKEYEIRVRLDAFSDGTYLLEEFSAEGADLIFLDIDMKYMMPEKI